MNLNFQLVAAASMFIASKLVEPCPITGTVLVQYADNSYQLAELLVSLNYTLKLEYLRNDHQKMLIIFRELIESGLLRPTFVLIFGKILKDESSSEKNIAGVAELFCLVMPDNWFWILSRIIWQVDVIWNQRTDLLREILNDAIKY